MNDIFKKGETYRKQMDPIRKIIGDFIEPIGWTFMSRGRKAHASAYGKINGFNGILDVIIEEQDWELLPDEVTSETSFDLYSSATKEIPGERQFSIVSLHWKAPFEMLIEVVPRFLPQAWEMLCGLTDEEFVEEWPGPSLDPRLPPDFGPPHRRPNC